MLNNIIKYSIQNKLITGLFVLALVVWGSFSLSNLPIDAVPDITNNQVQIITTSPSLAAEDVERFITFPIELTMATIPDIEEIRSMSRFGLSVVTIVFEEDVDVYWARQQVNERLPEAANQIPAGVGEPWLAPVSTGLGEIYQYVVTTKPGYEKKYSSLELRSIQDWIVRRQLLGTPGVADVSSIGGKLKQYEIAINADRLKSMNISITDIFTALEQNNENTGGAYIEQSHSAYFIRSEGLVGTIEDIENIVIKNNANGNPVFIKQVAEVKLGHAVRYGATTRNGKGEVVSAIAMMLKGENSAEVIGRIKDKIEQIGKSLPEGVVIEPFLDRTKLVDNAIGTVAKNLTEGALIVIFVLLLLLGNFRAGLIVASVIPLALLFAFGMMNLFGVSGNLMSLGAIDFGLIVDGAVIIVEATLHHFAVLKGGQRLTQKQMDEEVFDSAAKIRNSAAFGEIIILIVYLPLLALVGTEGKMFRPMAQTVSFAILGAFILSITYVPMISALFLNKTISHKHTISDRIISRIHRIYSPVIHWALDYKKMVLVSVIAVFLGSLVVFSHLGGEFIPTLDEGDFALETRLMTGSTLQNTIETTTEVEKILLEQFPEVLQVVSKIGAGEIPTDPMPIEAADVMVILKDKSEWVSAKTKEELAEKMGEALEALPGVAFGFQQPIQMRFNELMSGVKQDVAIKIYGEDLNVLSDYAGKIGKIVSSTAGAQDLYNEEVTGVDQIVVHYDRTKIAKFGFTIKEVNTAIQTAFSGAYAGQVYEGEKRFDLVIRLNNTERKNKSDVANLFVTNNAGLSIPLRQLASVEFQEGAYQIQRDDTKRRIIVAFNVRNRDVQSIVEEIQSKLDTSIKLPPGYFTTFGGQFENLVKAKKRLMVAVPAALFLIFILLYFTFHSFSQSLLIFTAIPLSAIGGIFALWLRDMPFSISAGVGFIALFGVAVLNGIVLIAEFNRLKKENMSLMERIFKGTETRLRPVILTASVASLGFLPMALSTSSGAEVQQPLATVVIGGLLSATFLTLVVLPILYYYFEKGFKIKNSNGVTVMLLFLMTGINAQAQNTADLDQLIALADKNNVYLKAADFTIDRQEALEGASWNLPKTKLDWMHGQYNSIYSTDNQFTVNQSFAFPSVYANQKKVASQTTEIAAVTKNITRNDLMREIKSTYYSLWFAHSQKSLIQKQDTIYTRFAKAAALRVKTGEANMLEKVSAETALSEVKVKLNNIESDIEIYHTHLQTLLKGSLDFELTFDSLETKLLPTVSDTNSVNSNPNLEKYRQLVALSTLEHRVEKAKLLPEFSIGYFNLSLNGPNQDIDGNYQFNTSSNRFQGFMVGIDVPLWIKPYTANIRAANIKAKETQVHQQAIENSLKGQWLELVQAYNKSLKSVTYYQQQALPQANLMLSQFDKSFKNGAINYVEYLQGLNSALSVRFNYLTILNQHNQTIIQIEALAGLN